MANTYVLIASNTLSSSAASVTFSSIPGTYTDLVLKISARSDESGGSQNPIYMKLNNTSTGSLYSLTRIMGNGATVTSSRFTNRSSDLFYEDFINAGQNTANTFSNNEIYISNYTSTTSKTISVFGAQETNATTAYLTANASLFRNTSAITQISLTCDANFVSGSSFFLYGVKSS